MPTTYTLAECYATLRIFIVFFTSEYTQCTAGYTFCFVVVVVGGVVVGVVTPLIKLGNISATDDQT
jgi:hypothetical protein